MEFDIRKVLTFKDVDEARALVGRKVAYGDSIDDVDMVATKGVCCILAEIDMNNYEYPFLVEGNYWRYVHPAEDFKVGDTVRIFRAFSDGENTLSAEDVVKRNVGREFVVKEVSDGSCLIEFDKGASFYIRKTVLMKVVYRPFLGDELFEQIGKCVRSKSDGKVRSIIIGADKAEDTLFLHGIWYSSKALLEDFEFVDGSPCGALL
jgi:hypothetical protein